jgi:hypothetical protein
MSSKTKKRKLTEVEKLKDLANAAANKETTARKTWTTESKRKVLPTKDIEALEELYKTAKEAAETALKVATEAAIKQRKANEEAALAAALERIEENAERNEENAEKTTKRINTTVYKTAAQLAFEREFEEKEAAKAAEAMTKKAKRNVERNANETRRRRINNIKSKTNIKRKDVEAFVQTINALNLGLDSEQIAHIITLAGKAKVDVEDVLALIDSDLTYGTEENAISFLKFATKRELDLEAFTKELKRKRIPFDEIVVLLEDIPNEEDLSEAELAYVLDLAHKAGVPVDIAIDLYHGEPVKEEFTMSKRIKLMRLAYLTAIPMDRLLHPTNSWANLQNISNAEKHLAKMKANGKTFAEFLDAKREKNLRNLEEARARAKSKSVNRTRLINTLNRTKKVERPTYKSVAAKRTNDVKDTFTGLKVNNLPITDMLIRTKKDIQDIADVLRGCFRGGIFGKKKGTPEIKTVYIPINKATKHPKGYAFIEYHTHAVAKEALDYMKRADTKKPTYGKTDHEIKGKDVAPAYGEEFFKYENSAFV